MGQELGRQQVPNDLVGLDERPGRGGRDDGDDPLVAVGGDHAPGGAHQDKPTSRPDVGDEAGIAIVQQGNPTRRQGIHHTRPQIGVNDAGHPPTRRSHTGGVGGLGVVEQVGGHRLGDRRVGQMGDPGLVADEDPAQAGHVVGRRAKRPGIQAGNDLGGERAHPSALLVGGWVLFEVTSVHRLGMAVVLGRAKRRERSPRRSRVQGGVAGPLGAPGTQW